MFTLKFSTDNAAFEDREAECVRILSAVARSVGSGKTGGRIMDANGNIVGEWSLDEA